MRNRLRPSAQLYSDWLEILSHLGKIVSQMLIKWTPSGIAGTKTEERAYHSVEIDPTWAITVKRGST